MDRKTAEEVSRMLLESYKDLLDMIDLARADAADESERRTYVRAIAQILGHMSIDLLDPIFEDHPDLRPDWLS